MDLSDTAAMQIPLYIAPTNLSTHPRSGSKYRAYSEDDMARAEQAITQEGLSLRQASIRFSVPKTTLAERLGDKRPKPPPRKSDEENKLRTRYQWTESDMANAVEAVQNGDKIGEAARRFGVPASHLNARTRGRAPKNLRSELSRLTLRQEGLLADWATAQSALGCPANWMRRYPQIEILEWESKELKPKKSKKGTDSTLAFSVSSFEPIIDLNELCYDVTGTA
ncbi:hypothetical protein F4774DRAFT_372203 [Daldinia eschscholtzii]|nr:hypothetical protein F4774DRAFT_372203 [Daldinia eschscholtzii]